MTEKECLVLSLVAITTNDAVLAGRLLQVCSGMQKHRKTIIESVTTVVGEPGFYKIFLLNGRKHRENGLPAYMSPTQNSWFVNDVFIRAEPVRAT